MPEQQKKASERSQDEDASSSTQKPKKRAQRRSRASQRDIRRIRVIASHEWQCPVCEKFISADTALCPNDSSRRIDPHYVEVPPN